MKQIGHAPTSTFKAAGKSDNKQGKEDKKKKKTESDTQASGHRDPRQTEKDKKKEEQRAKRALADAERAKTAKALLDRTFKIGAGLPVAQSTPRDPLPGPSQQGNASPSSVLYFYTDSAAETASTSGASSVTTTVPGVLRQDLFGAGPAHSTRSRVKSGSCPSARDVRKAAERKRAADRELGLSYKRSALPHKTPVRTPAIKPSRVSSSPDVTAMAAANAGNNVNNVNVDDDDHADDLAAQNMDVDDAVIHNIPVVAAGDQEAADAFADMFGAGVAEVNNMMTHMALDSPVASAETAPFTAAVEPPADVSASGYEPGVSAACDPPAGIEAWANAAAKQNGQIRTAIEAAPEPEIPTWLRIPVPNNIYLIGRQIKVYVAGQGANRLECLRKVSRVARVNVARAMQALVEQDNDIDVAVRSLAAYVAHLTHRFGLIDCDTVLSASALSNNPATRKSALEAYAWSGEVRIVDEVPFNEVFKAVEERPNEVGPCNTALAAIGWLKLAWWTNGHHYGGQDTTFKGCALTGLKMISGNTTVLPNFGLDFTTADGCKWIYRAVHPVSSRAVIRKMAVQAYLSGQIGQEVIEGHEAIPSIKLAGDLAAVQAALPNATTHLIFPKKGVYALAGPEVNLSDFPKFDPAMLLRAVSPGEGTHKIVNVVMVVKDMLSNGCLVGLPDLPMLSRLCAQAAYIKAQPWVYGKAAKYLVGDKAVVVDQSAADKYVGYVSTYVRTVGVVTLPESVQRMAAVQTDKVKAPPSFQAFCRSVRAKMSDAADATAVVNAFVRLNTGAVSADSSAAVIAISKILGGPTITTDDLAPLFVTPAAAP